MTRDGATLTGGGAPALMAWRAFREAYCREITGFDWRGGSGAGAAGRSRMLGTAAARVRDLTARHALDRAALPPSRAE